MSKARQYRRQAVEYAQQSLLAEAHHRPMFNLLARTWLELAEREDERARLGEPRSFAPGARQDISANPEIKIACLPIVEPARAS